MNRLGKQYLVSLGSDDGVVLGVEGHSLVLQPVAFLWKNLSSWAMSGIEVRQSTSDQSEQRLVVMSLEEEVGNNRQ